MDCSRVVRDIITRISEYRLKYGERPKVIICPMYYKSFILHYLLQERISIDKIEDIPIVFTFENQYGVY